MAVEGILQLMRMLHVAGYGTEAAIGQLTCLTKLQMSVDRDRASRSTGKQVREAANMHGCRSPLQLQLLGGGSDEAASGNCEDVTGASSCSGSSGGGRAAGASRNTRLQDLSIECSGGLTDDEVAAAAGALPDLRQLEVIASPGQPADVAASLHGCGLATLSTCHRLQHFRLSVCANLDGRELAAHLPSIGSVVKLQLARCPGVDDSNIRELQAAFWAKHGRQLPVLAEGQPWDNQLDYV